MKPIVYHIICPPHWVKTPPLAGEYLRTFAQKHGIEIKLLDLNNLLFNTYGKETNDWLKLNDRFEQSLFEEVIQGPFKKIIHGIFKELACADIIAFSLYRRNQYFTFAFIEELAYAYPDKKIVIGGPQTRWMELQKKPFDPRFSWIVGEGEKALLKVIDSKSSCIIRFDELEDLDEIPFLDFSQYDLNLYSQTLPLLSSRGCIRRCAFCTERLLANTFRQHSPEYMAEQIALFHNTYNTRTFSFQDSLINADNAWLESFCRTLIKKNMHIIWEAQAIIRDDLDISLAHLLKKSGCYNLFIGLESADNEMLRMMNKGFTQHQAHTFFSTLNKAGLHYEVSLILGYPEETDQQFQNTYEFVRQNKLTIPKIAQVNPYVDYFSDKLIPQGMSMQRVDRLVTMLKEEKIKYTKSFINNLIYQEIA